MEASGSDELHTPGPQWSNRSWVPVRSMWPNAMALVLLWGTAICEKCVKIYEEDGIWNHRSATSCFKLKTLIVKSTLSFYSYASQSQQCTRAQDRSFGVGFAILCFVVSKSSRFAIRLQNDLQTSKTGSMAKLKSDMGGTPRTSNLWGLSDHGTSFWLDSRNRASGPQTIPSQGYFWWHLRAFMHTGHSTKGKILGPYEWASGWHAPPLSP